MEIPWFKNIVNIYFYSGNQPTLKPHELNAAAALLQHSNRIIQPEMKPWKPHSLKQHGAARLFSYMEASDNSEPDGDSHGPMGMGQINLNHRVQSDFHEAGDVGNSVDEEEEEDMELPLFVCLTCGCEFEDDGSLETHQHTHCHNTTSPAKTEDVKENINPKHYKCQICNMAFVNQNLVITHMNSHSSLFYSSNSQSLIQEQREYKRSRKQSQPKKILTLLLDCDNINMKSLQEKQQNSYTSFQLVDKYMARIVTRQGYTCRMCRTSRISRFYTRQSYFFHCYWRHSKKNNFQCEHCDEFFKHRYQVVIHSSRIHAKRYKTPDDGKQIHVTNDHISNMHISSEEHNLLNNNQTGSIVPDTINGSVNVHKLGISFFDHSFLHSNTNSINNHMPIIIPTFPQN